MLNINTKQIKQQKQENCLGKNILTNGTGHGLSNENSKDPDQFVHSQLYQGLCYSNRPQSIHMEDPPYQVLKFMLFFFFLLVSKHVFVILIGTDSLRQFH